ncbi:SMP-30/gluconolactonase/LRE family protein [Pseudozobellia thermophila]|uniref:Gluconolactonase n=1 Tax=Pseudozobellia thermophila TaxID=192903 RepID=A0A1M6MMQ5_9FLAO|nr:SMP-30/gluconolactonase/LRE family protein [Pseudozobellia thermophila]SHJ84775.1 gluconolactonase [Pseudozobellia thermophila]
MKNLVVCLGALLCGLQLSSQKVKPDARIEILNGEALRVLDPDAEIEIVANGFEWTEGPLYVNEGKYLLFSDIPNNAVFKIDMDGKVSEYLRPSGYSSGKDYGDEPGSNGLLLSPQGELVLMQHGNRQVAKMKSSLDGPKAEYEVLVDQYEGKRLNSPNDGVFDKEGNLYFTDPPYGLPGKMDDPNKELDFQGLYCLTKEGKTILVDKLSRPNGVALSTDGAKLYVAVSNPEHAVWYEYDILDVGKAVNKRIFYNVTELVGQKGQQGLPDGMKMHSKGFLFATGPGGVWVFTTEGRPVARIHTGEKTSNCAFDATETRLFMTADDYILSVRLR